MGRVGDRLKVLPCLENERASEEGFVTAPVHGEDLIVEVLDAELLGSYENTSSVS